MINKNRIRLLLVCIICSLAFLSIPLLAPPPGDEMFSPRHIQDILGYVVALGLFYFYYFYAVPALYFTKKYGWFILSCMLGFAVLVYVPNLLHMHDFPPRPRFRMHGGPPQGTKWHFLFGHIIHNALRFAVILSVAMMLRINNRYKNIQQEQMNTELSFLKAQVNPHFLFNTLNSIYSLALTKSDKAPEAVVKLSGIMRYAISEAEQEYVSLEKEIGYINNYIELQKLRLTDKVKLVYNTEGNFTGKQIVPFLLIPFVENAFKYGVNSEENSKIIINILAGVHSLHMQVTNNKVYVQTDENNATGLGLENTRKRLELSYAGKYDLDVRDEADNFKVSLNIELV